MELRFRRHLLAAVCWLAHQDQLLSTNVRTINQNATYINSRPGVIELVFDALELSTKDQLLFSTVHGTALRYAAERRNLDESIEELRQIADSRNDILAEAAGITAGSW